MHYKYGTKKEKKNGWQKPREKCIETRKYMEAKKEQNSNNNNKKLYKPTIDDERERLADVREALTSCMHGPVGKHRDRIDDDDQRSCLNVGQCE